MSVEVISLGCRLNIAESEDMRAMLGESDDLVVVNSCAVTSEAVRQTRQSIRRARRERPDARLLVTGCAAEIERDAFAAMPEVDGLVANESKLDPRAWNVPPRKLPAGHVIREPSYLSRTVATMPAPSALSRKDADRAVHVLSKTCSKM